MPLAVFAGAVVGGLLWFLFIFLAVPYLAAQVVALLATRFTPYRVSLAAIHIYPLAGSVVLRGLVVVWPDAAIEVRQAALAARWWLREAAVDTVRHASAATALFIVSLDGLRVRVVNNTTAYAALEKTLRGGGEAGAGAGDGEQSAFVAWLGSRTSVRVGTGAVYVMDGSEAGAGMLRILGDSCKLRYSVLETYVRGHVRRDVGRLMISKLHVAVVLPADRSEGVVLGGERASTLPRGIKQCYSRLRHDEALDCVPLLSAETVVCSYTADVAGVGLRDAGYDDGAQPVAFLDMKLDRAQLTHDGASLSVAQGIFERLSPCLYNLEHKDHSPESLPGTPAAPLTVLVSAVPKRGEPLILYPFLPRDLTWRGLDALNLATHRGLSEETHAGMLMQSFFQSRSKSTSFGEDVPSAQVHQAHSVSSVAILASMMTGEFEVPVSALQPSKVTLTLNDVRVNVAGIRDVPFIRTPRLELTYSEKGRESWNESRVATINAVLERPRVLYAMDCFRAIEDVSFAFASHARTAEDVRFFIPYDLTVNISSVTGYAIRFCLQDMNAWPSLQRALDDVPQNAVAEVRGKTGSVSISATSSSEHATLVSLTRFRVDLPHVEMFMVFPLKLPASKSNSETICRRNASSPQDVDEDSFSDFQENTTRREKKPVLSDRIRHVVDDAANTATRFGIGNVRRRASSEYVNQEGGVARSETRVHTCCHEVRIAHAEGALSVSGQTTVLIADIALGLDKDNVRLDAGCVVLDVNPHHAAFISNMVDNLVGSMTHSLTFKERQQVLDRRASLEKELSACVQDISQSDSFTLGLNAGQVGPRRSFAAGMKNSFSAEFDDVVLRLHVLPDAACCFANDAKSVVLVRMGSVAIVSEATIHGMVVEVRPVDPGTTATLSSDFGRRESPPCLRTSFWKWTRSVVCDDTGSPMSFQTSLCLGQIVGSVTMRALLSIGRFGDVVRRSSSPLLSEAMEALWTVLSLSVIVDQVDMLVLLCDDQSDKDTLAGVLHVVAQDGFRSNVNNLCTSAAMGHSAFVMPVIYSDFFAPVPFKQGGSWDVAERRLRAKLSKRQATTSAGENGVSQEGMAFPAAARLKPTCIRASMLDRPRMWTRLHAIRQARRLKNAEALGTRLSYLHSPFNEVALSPFVGTKALALFDVPWWRDAAVDRTWKTGQIEVGVATDGSVSEAEIRVHFCTNLHLTVGPRSLLAVKRCVQALLLTSDAVELQSGISVSESDMLSVWTWHAKAWNSWQSPTPSCTTSRFRFFLDLEKFSLKLLSPLEFLISSKDGDSALDGARFARQYANDGLLLLFDAGAHVGLSIYNSERSAESGSEMNQNVLFMYGLRMIVPKAAVMDSLGTELLLTKGVDVRLDQKILSAGTKDTTVEREGKLSLRTCRLGNVVDKLESFTSLGRVLCVYGLLLRCIGVDYMRALGACNARFSAATSYLINFSPKHCAGMACIGMMQSRQDPAVDASPLSFHDGLGYRTPRSQIVARCRDGNVLNRSSWREQFAKTLGSPVIGLERPSASSSARTSWWHEIGMTDMSVCIDMFEVLVLGQMIACTKRVRIRGWNHVSADAREAVVDFGCDTLRLAGRDDIVSGLLNATTSTAYHATRASEFLPIPARPGKARDSVSLPDSFDIDVASANWRGGASESLLSGEALTGEVNRLTYSQKSGTVPQLVSDNLDRPRRDFIDGSETPRNMQVPSRVHSGAGTQVGKGLLASFSTDGVGPDCRENTGGTWNSWFQKATHAAESALASVWLSGHRDSSTSIGNENPTGSAANASPSGGLPGPRSTATMLLSCCLLDLSYRHQGSEASAELGEPDLRLTVAGLDGSMTLGPNSHLQSIIVATSALSLKSRNHANCILTGSVSRTRTCGTIASSGIPLSLPAFAVSSVIHDVDLCLEAADIRSVLYFRDRLSGDVKSCGEALIAAEAAVRTMLRANQILSSGAATEDGQEKALFSGIGFVSMNISIQKMTSILAGFHPGDSSMHIAHEASSIFWSCALSEQASAVLILGGRIQGHSLVTSASHWSSAERFRFPGLDVCGIQWSHECALPTQLELKAGPSINSVSFQGIRNLLFAANGLLAFQSESGYSATTPNETQDASRDRIALPSITILEGSLLSRAVAAWERTKAVRMDVRHEPISMSLCSGSVELNFDIGVLAGVVEWKRFLDSGVQLHGALVIPPVTLLYCRSLSDAKAPDVMRQSASLLIDFGGGRMDVLKSQSGLVHKFVFRFVLGSIVCKLRPWQFMEDAAAWADEQDFIKEVQAMHLGVSQSARGRGSLPMPDETTNTSPPVFSVGGDTSLSHEPPDARSVEHRLLEMGLEVSHAVLHIPLLIDENGSHSRLLVPIREVTLKVRFGDDQALPSQLNLAKARIRSFAVLWDGSDLFNSSQTQLTFAVRRSPSSSGAHLGSLQGSVSLGSWVIYPRQEFVVAVLDARLARQAYETRAARAKLGSLPELLSRSGRDGAESETGSGERQRVLFESIEILMLPSPGFIEGLEVGCTSIDLSKSRYRTPNNPPTTYGDQAHPSVLYLPIPLFSVGVVRQPLYSFDLVDINFSRKLHEKFPDGCLGRAAKLFSELFGAVATRTQSGLLQVEPVEVKDARRHQNREGSDGGRDPTSDDAIDLFGRDWSALVRFGESRYTAHEVLFGKLETRLSFYAGQGSGALASMFRLDSPMAEIFRMPGGVSKEMTVISAASPMFKLELHPKLSTASPQVLALQSVKLLQGYIGGLVPHSVLHVAEVKAELDIVTILLSREWIGHSKAEALSGVLRSPRDPVAATAHQAALSLASAAPSETRLMIVLGEFVATEEAEMVRQRQAANSFTLPQNRKALLLRLRLAQPDGRVGLVVKRVYIGIGRQTRLPIETDPTKFRSSRLVSEVEVTIHHATSRADWEHLSYDCGFQRLMLRADSEELPNDNGGSEVQCAGLALLLHKFRFKCKRDENDALKLEIDGAAAALCIDLEGCESSLQSMNVDAYISSSTVKTINRLRQLQSRLLRSLMPQVERLILAESRRKSSHQPASVDAADTFGNDIYGGEASRVLPAATPKLIDSISSVDDANETRRAKYRLSVPSHVSVTGVQLVITMHGFSFDANQPQAKLIFTSYDIEYAHRLSSPKEEGTLEVDSETIAADGDSEKVLRRVLELQYELLDVQYSDQRQHSITVMSLPNPHLILRVLESPETAVVFFSTQFERAVEASPSVSHYDYLRQLLSLYRSATISSLARTVSAMDPGSSSMATDGDIDSDGAVAIGFTDSGGSDRDSARDGRDRWGGRQVNFKELEFAPRLSPLGDLTPEVAAVLGWLGVGSVEALPSGLYELLMIPMSSIASKVAKVAKL
jgi:hypothetical protein